jgi:hypothetical protein
MRFNFNICRVLTQTRHSIRMIGGTAQNVNFDKIQRKGNGEQELVETEIHNLLPIKLLEAAYFGLVGRRLAHVGKSRSSASELRIAGGTSHSSWYSL